MQADGASPPTTSDLRVISTDLESAYTSTAACLQLLDFVRSRSCCSMHIHIRVRVRIRNMCTHMHAYICISIHMQVGTTLKLEAQLLHPTLRPERLSSVLSRASCIIAPQLQPGCTLKLTPPSDGMGGLYIHIHMSTHTYMHVYIWVHSPAHTTK